MGLFYVVWKQISELRACEACVSGGRTRQTTSCCARHLDEAGTLSAYVEMGSIPMHSVFEGRWCKKSNGSTPSGYDAGGGSNPSRPIMESCLSMVKDRFAKPRSGICPRGFKSLTLRYEV